MKNLKKSILLVFVVILMSCEQPLTQSPNLAPLTKDNGDTSIYAVSYSTFVKDTTKFAELSAVVFKQDLKWKNPLPIKAFTIRAADLLETMGLPPGVQCTDSIKYNYARIYLGVDENNNIKLYLTPVTGAHLMDSVAGNDVILDGPYQGDVLDGEVVSNGQYVMDFTSPCPKTCPDGN